MKKILRSIKVTFKLIFKSNFQKVSTIFFQVKKHSCIWKVILVSYNVQQFVADYLNFSISNSEDFEFKV